MTLRFNTALHTSSSSKHSNAHLYWQHLQDVTWVMRVTEQTAPLLCLVCYESSMIKLPSSADKRSVCLSFVLFFIISKGTAAMTRIRLWQIHSTALWLVVNQEVRSHRSNFTMRPGRSRAPDNTTCWHSGRRKSWDTNPWTHTNTQNILYVFYIWYSWNLWCSWAVAPFHQSRTILLKKVIGAIVTGS